MVLHNVKAGGQAFASKEEAVAFVESTMDYLVTRYVCVCVCLWRRTADTARAASACCYISTILRVRARRTAHPTLPPANNSRPTAVNLADSAAKLKAAAAAAARTPAATAASVTQAVIAAAEATLEEDIAANKAMGAIGAKVNKNCCYQHNTIP